MQLDVQLTALGLNQWKWPRPLARSLAEWLRRIVSYLHIAGYSGSGLGEIIDYDFNQCSLSRLYRVSDQLLRAS
ncbi:MAG: hypothetical protein IPP22_14605 [Nitrosomonas sp.]|nr:hypothetical protein [Nitrosomonas sp.]